MKTKTFFFCATLISLFAISISVHGAEVKPTVEDGVKWYDTTQWEMGSRGWSEGMESHFCRLPDKAKGVIPDSVWNLSRQSSGLVVRFKTDAKDIFAKHKVKNALAMPHMTAVGVSGLDLYNREDDGKWYWAGFSKPTEKEYTMPLSDGMSQKEREYQLYLPLYNVTESLSIGVKEGFTFEPLPPIDKKPVVYYGTSITHGCSASRPGMAYTSMLSRTFDRPFINLGFSGSGRMEIEMADLIAEIDAEVYALDCLPNMTQAHVDTRTEPFIRRLRELRPETPILLVEDRTISNARLRPWWQENHDKKRAEYRRVYEKLRDEGMKGLSYLPADNLLGSDDEGTIDCSHPNDLGMKRMADALEPVLRKIMEQ